MWIKLKSEFAQAKYMLGFASLQAVGQAMGMVIPLVLGIIFSKETFGSYTMSETIIFFFTAVLIFSAKIPFIVFANQERSQTGAIRTSFTAQCIFLAASIILFFLFIIVFMNPLKSFSQLTASQMWFLTLAFLGITLKDFSGNLFMALNQRNKAAMLDIGFGVIAFALLAIAYFSQHLTLQAVFLIYFASSAIILLTAMKTIDRKLLFPFEFKHSHFSEMFYYTVWLTVGAASVYLVNWAGIIIMKWFGVSLPQIGTYNIATKFFKAILVLTYIVPTYFLPMLSEHILEKKKIQAYLYAKRPRVMLLGLGCLVLAWFAIGSIIHIIYSGKYDDAITAARWLIVGNVFVLYIAMYGPLFAALKVYKFPQIANAVQACINILFSLILIPRYSICGAAIATVASYAGLAVILELYFRFRIKKMLEATV